MKCKMGNYFTTQKRTYFAKISFHGSEHVFNNLQFKKDNENDPMTEKYLIDMAKHVEFLKVENPLIVNQNDELEMLEEDTGIFGEESTGIYKIYKMRNKNSGDVGIVPSIIVASEGISRER